MVGDNSVLHVVDGGVGVEGGRPRPWADQQLNPLLMASAHHDVREEGRDSPLVYEMTAQGGNSCWRRVMSALRAWMERWLASTRDRETATAKPSIRLVCRLAGFQGAAVRDAVGQQRGLTPPW